MKQAAKDATSAREMWGALLLYAAVLVVALAIGKTMQPGVAQTALYVSPMIPFFARRLGRGAPDSPLRRVHPQDDARAHRRRGRRHGGVDVHLRLSRERRVSAAFHVHRVAGDGSCVGRARDRRELAGIDEEHHSRASRFAPGWSQAALADLLDVSRQTINAIETGRYDPSLPLAFAIARVFETSIEAIFSAE